jgi:hypothetical protein
MGSPDSRTSVLSALEVGGWGTTVLVGGSVLLGDQSFLFGAVGAVVVFGVVFGVVFVVIGCLGVVFGMGMLVEGALGVVVCLTIWGFGVGAGWVVVREVACVELAAR